MPDPDDIADASKVTSSPDTRTWIAKMFVALKLGEPSFAKPKPEVSASPGGEPPGDPGGDGPKAEPDDSIEPRRVALRLRLDAITLHAQVSTEERSAISGHLTDMRTLIATATRAEEFDDIETALNRIEGLAAGANVAAAARAVRCDAVDAAMSGITRPEGGVKADYAAYDADAALVDAIAAVPVVETTLAAAEAAVARLKQEAERLGDVLAARAKRATAVRSAIPAKLPDGANDDETGAVRAAEEKALAALGTEDSPLSETAVSEAEAQIGHRKTALEAAEKGIATRKAARKVVADQLDKADLGGLTEAEGLQALSVEKQAIGDALATAKTDSAIAALSLRAGTLVGNADAARTARAKAILARLAELGDPPALPKDEAQPLADQIALVRDGATAPLTATGLMDAAKALATLPDLLKAAADTLADRTARVQKAAAAAALVDDPAHANGTEAAALDLLRKAAALSPKPPLSEGMALAAEDALKAVTDLKAEQVLAIAAREKARTSALDMLLTLVPPLNAPGTVLVALLKKSGLLRSKIEAGQTLVEIEALQGDIKVLEKEVKALTDFTKARDAAWAKLGAAQIAVEKASYEINQGCYQKALALSKAAHDLLDKAASEADCTAAEVKVAEIAPLLGAAKAYQPDMELWRFDTEMYVTGLPSTTDAETAAKEAMSKLREELLDQADALAATGDVAKAKAKLDEWKTAKAPYLDGVTPKEASFDAARFKTAKDFSDKVEIFAKDCVPIIRATERLALEGPAASFQSKYLALKKKGFETGDVAGAEGELATLTIDVNGYKDIVARLEKLATLAGTKPYDDALAKAKSGDLGGAKLELDSISTAVSEDAEFAARRNGLQKRVTAYLLTLVGPGKAAIEDPWTEAPKQVTLADKMAKLQAVEDAAKEARQLEFNRDAATALCGRHDSSKAYGILAAAAAVEQVSSLADATKAYVAAAEDARRLAAYAAKVAILSQSRKALPKDPPETDDAVRDALAKAEVLAKQRKWDEAENELAVVETIPLVQTASATLAVFQAKRDKLQRVQTRLVAQIGEPKPKAALVDPWNAAIEMAETKGDPVEATALLIAHEAVLATAQAYAGAASEARLGLAAMEKIETRAVAHAHSSTKAAAEQEVWKAEGAVTRAAEAVTETEKKLAQAVLDVQKAQADVDAAEKDVTAAKSKSALEKKVAADAKVEAVENKKKADAAKKKADTAVTNAKKKKTEADKKVSDLKAALAKKIADDGLAAATAVTDAIYATPMDKAALQKLLATAEVEAGKGDFAKAIAAFKDVCVAAQSGMKAAAKAIEVAESGHYVSAHGPDVTDTASTIRLLTGKRPDGKMEPSSTSSSFGSIEALLATREAALTELNTKFPATSATTLKKDDVLEYFVETDSEVPVGKSFKGNKMKKKYQGGEFKESRLCETFRELGPLTRVFTKVIFHFDNPNPASLKPLTNWKDVLEAYKPTPPATFPGQWVVHQHYPTATDFDPETGEYMT